MLAISSSMKNREGRPPKTRTEPPEGVLDMGSGDFVHSGTGDVGMASAISW